MHRISRVWLFLAVLFALSLFGVRLHAQGVRYQNIAITPTGVPAAGADVRVCSSPATGTPCTPLVTTLYADSTLNPLNTITNPFKVDRFGNYFFYAPQGTYTIQVTYKNVTTTYPDQVLGLPLVPKGTWDVNTAYNANDLVYYNNNAYYATGANTGQTPGVAGVWQIFVQGGGGGSVSIQVNGGSSSSQSLLNFVNGTGIAVTNPSGGNINFTFAPPQSTVANLANIASPAEGQLAIATDQQKGFYEYLNAWWHPFSIHIDARKFGVRGDGGWYPLSKCTSGSATIQASLQNITNAAVLPKVGQTAVVSGCGLAGADLSCTIASVSGTSSFNCGGGVVAGATTGFTQGARWGWSVDDTAAIQAIVNFCQINGSNGGCIVDFPAGSIFINTVNIPATVGAQNIGQILFQGSGNQATKFIGIGANQSSMFQGTSASTETTGFRDLGFDTYDWNNKRPIGIDLQGGNRHLIENVHMTNLYQPVRMSNTWINWILRSYFYGNSDICVNFDPITGPVNFTTVRDSEFSGCRWAISNTSGVGHGFSEGNLYSHNDCEGTQTDGCINLQAEWLSTIEYLRNEVDAGRTDGAWRALKTSNVQLSSFIGNNFGCKTSSDYCVELGASTQSNYFNGTNPDLGSVPNIARVLASGGRNSWVGPWLNDTDFTGSAATQQMIIGGNQPTIRGGSLTVYSYTIGSAYDLPYGRVDVSGTPIGRSNSSLTNPSTPTQIGTAGIVPAGMIFFNQYTGSNVATPRDNNLGWLCLGSNGLGGVNNGNCSANPITASQWARWGEIYTRVRGEYGFDPTGLGKAHQAGDWYWNLNGTTAGQGLMGYWASVGGTPGTFLKAYAIDPAVPPAWGTTTPNTGAFTTLSTSGVATLNSANVTNGLTAATVNKVTITTPATSATLTIANGKTLTVSNSMQLLATDSAVLTFQGTDTYVGRGTTDTLANKTLAAPVIQATVVASLPAAASSTGQVYVVSDSNSATSCSTGGGSNIVLCRSNGSSWLPLGDGASSGAAAFASLTGGTNTGAAMLVGTGASLGTTGTGTIQATNVLGAGLTFAGSTSGTTVLQATGVASGTLTLPAATDTLVGKSTTDTLANKTLDNTTVLTIKDGSLTLQNTADTTKQAVFSLASITAGQTRTVTIANGASTTVIADTGAANNFVTAISASGVISKAQPNFTDLAGNIAVAQMNSGTGASSSTWWRGDGTWATLPSGSGTVNSGAQYAFPYYATAGTAVSAHPNFKSDANGNLISVQGANGSDAFVITRNTELSSSGNYIRLMDTSGGSDRLTVDINGNLFANTLQVIAGTVYNTMGQVGTCLASPTNLGQICFSSTGNRPVWGYNGGSNTNIILATDTLAALSATTSAQLASLISDEQGSGSLVFATSPTLTTPNIGVATATSVNKVTITAPASSATLTIADGKTLGANNSLTFAGTDGTTMTFPATSSTVFTSVTKADVLEAGQFCSDAGASDTYACSLNPAITAYVTGATYWFKANTANTGAATLNLNALGAKTIKKHAGGITSDLVDNDIRAGSWVAVTYDGTNLQCMDGCDGNAASGTITSGTTNALAKYTAATTIGPSALSDDGTTLSYSGTGGISTTGTAAGIITLGQGTAQSLGTNAVGLTVPTSVTSYNLVFPAAANSGVLVWTNSTNTVTGAFAPTTGTGNAVLATSPTLTTPSFSSIVNTGTLTLPTSTDTLVGRATTDTLTNKTIDSGGTGNHIRIGGNDLPSALGTANQILAVNGTATGIIWVSPAGGGNVSNSGTPTSGQVAEWTSATVIQGVSTTGSGNYVKATSPTLVTPTLGVATVTSVNKMAITAPTTAATLAFGTDNATITFQGTDTYVGRATSDTFTNKTISTAGTGNHLQINGLDLPSTSGTANQVISMNGAGTAIVWATPAGGGNVSNSGTPSAGQAAEWVTSTSIQGVAVTGTGNYVKDTSPTLVTPTLGVASATTINKLTITAPATGSTLTIADGKTLTSSNTLTFAGTDSTTITFQGTDTYVGRATTDTLTNKTIDAEGTGNSITIPMYVEIGAAGCNNTTAGPAFDLPTSAAATVTCFGTTTTQGALDFVDASTTGATYHFTLPGDWAGNFDIDLFWFANAASANAVRWSVQTGCVADSEAISTGPSYNTASASNTAYTGTANQRKTTSFTNVAMTNCAANETVYVMVQRIGGDAGDTLAATAELLGARLKLRRAM